MTTEIAEYSKTEAALADLAQKYKGVIFDVKNASGMKMAREARAEIRGYRTSLEKMRVAIKEPALRKCQLIDSEARRITGALLALETPIDSVIQQEEERKEAIKRAAELAAKQAEEKRLADERAEIARRQAELDRAEREREELERQARAKIEAEERAARERIEAAERKSRLEQQAREEEERKKRIAEEERLRAERDAIDKTRREHEEQERKARIAEEEKQREIEKRKLEKLDARQMLDAFVEKYGHIYEFAEVVLAIKKYQKSKELK